MSSRFGPRVRLRLRHEFKVVQDQGTRVAMRSLTMLARPNALGRDRLGIVASKRVGGAVERNRAKRRLREVFRRHDPEGAPLSAHRSLDVVVIARAPVATAPHQEIEAEFLAALARLRKRIGT